jgi:hypothetical protein
MSLELAVVRTTAADRSPEEAPADRLARAAPAAAEASDACDAHVVVHHVKGRKRVRPLVCNSVAEFLVESVRGQHDKFVFVSQRLGRHARDRPA